MTDRGRGHLVIDPYQGFLMVFTDEYGNTVHRTLPQQSLDDALRDGAQWLGRPMTIEVKQVG